MGKESILIQLLFKQKTAYGVLRSLVGSEVCIRDGPPPVCTAAIVWRGCTNIAVFL